MNIISTYPYFFMPLEFLYSHIQSIDLNFFLLLLLKINIACEIIDQLCTYEFMNIHIITSLVFDYTEHMNITESSKLSLV